MEEESKGHFILVHGLCHGAWCWYKLATMLRSAGQRVTALDLAASGPHTKPLDELRSFSDYSQPLMEVMASLPAGERVVLVGHSYGGYSIALAAEKFPEKVSAAVFVTAAMPSISAPFYSFEQEFFKCHPSEFFMDCKFTISSEEPQTRSTSFTLGPNYMKTKLYQLCPPEDLALATMLVRPGHRFLDSQTSGDMVTEENYGSVSRVFIVCKEDLCLTEDFQRWIIAGSPGVEVKEIKAADHMVMLSKPKELSHLLLEIAREYRKRFHANDDIE